MSSLNPAAGCQSSSSAHRRPADNCDQPTTLGPPRIQQTSPGTHRPAVRSSKKLLCPATVSAENVHTPTFDSLSPADSDPNQGKCLRHHPHVNSPRQSLPLLSLLNPLPAIKSLRCMLRCGSLPHFDPAFRINPVVPTGVVRIHRPQFGPPSSIWTTAMVAVGNQCFSRTQCSAATLIEPAQSSRQYLRAKAKVKKFFATHSPRFPATRFLPPRVDQTCPRRQLCFWLARERLKC